MKKLLFSVLTISALIFSTIAPSFAATTIEPYVIPVDASISPYTSYFRPGYPAAKTAYWGGGNNVYGGYIDACILHSRSSEDVYVRADGYWYDDTWNFSNVTYTSKGFQIARFDKYQPGTTHKQRLYVYSGGSSAYAYSVVIER